MINNEEVYFEDEDNLDPVDAVTHDFDDMMEKYDKELSELHNYAKTSPYEWGCGFNYFIKFLEFMRDFYGLGQNVFSEEDCISDRRKRRELTRFESLSLALKYYDRWQNIEDEYITLVYHPETFNMTHNADDTCSIKDCGIEVKYRYKTAKKTYNKMNKARKKYKKLFFKTLNKYIEGWWD